MYYILTNKINKVTYKRNVRAISFFISLVLCHANKHLIHSSFYFPFHLVPPGYKNKSSFQAFEFSTIIIIC